MEFTKNVQVREEKFGTVIFETLKEKVYVTNPTGADIVRLLQQKKTADEIVNELASLYRTTADAISSDVRTFLGELTRNDVIA